MDFLFYLHSVYFGSFMLPSTTTIKNGPVLSYEFLEGIYDSVEICSIRATKMYPSIISHVFNCLKCTVECNLKLFERFTPIFFVIGTCTKHVLLKCNSASPNFTHFALTVKQKFNKFIILKTNKNILK